jgi:excisionase family DNA binding protein
MEKAFYRISEVAEIIGLGKSLTYKLIAEGQIPSVYLAGCRSRRVPAGLLRKWIAEEAAKVAEPKYAERRFHIHGQLAIPEKNNGH